MKEEKITCGNCGSRLLFHYQYNDVNKDSKYSRCKFRPELKQKNNSSPKWCPRKINKRTSYFIYK